MGSGAVGTGPAALPKVQLAFHVQKDHIPNLLATTPPPPRGNVTRAPRPPPPPGLGCVVASMVNGLDSVAKRNVVVALSASSHLAVLAAEAGAGLSICSYSVVMVFQIIQVFIGNFR